MPRKATDAPGGSANIEKARKAKSDPPTRERHIIQPRWWQLKGAKAAEAANSMFSTWIAQDRDRQNDLAYWAMLYRQSRIQFAGTSLAADRAVASGARGNPTTGLAATFNGIAAAVDTVTNTVAHHRPVVQFTTTNGDWNSHKIARMRGQFVAGWFHEQKVYQKTAIQFRDSCLFGDGGIGVFPRNGRAVVERVYPGDLFVDQASCYTTGEPREIGRIHLMDRHTAWMMFEGNAEAQHKIEMAPEAQLIVDAVQQESDLIQLNEMWRLPTVPGRKEDGGTEDGWHLFATQTDDLEMEPYRHGNFPFAFIVCTPGVFGFLRNQGYAELLKNNQLCYNDEEAAINLAQELGGTYHLFVNSQSNLVVDQIDNYPGSVLRGDAVPQSLLWQCVQPEIYEKQKERKAQFFEQPGITQMVATGEKVSPDESGIAIRQRLGVYDERHALHVQSYQDAHLMIATIGIQTISDIIESQKEAKARGEPVRPYTVFRIGKPEATPIDFEDLRFEPGEQYVTTCMPVNDLPSTVEGRIALAQDFVMNGWYDEATARDVFLAPFDVARVETLYNASRDYFSQVLDAIVEDNTDPPPPDGNDKLDMALQMALQQLAYAKLRKVAQGRQDKLTNYITAIKAKLIEKQKGDAQLAMQAPPAPSPLAQPEAPPTSPLIPNPNAPPAEA